MAPSRPARDATSPEQDLSYEVRVPTRGRLTSEQIRSHDVYIGRGREKLGLSRSEWCNPFNISKTQPRGAVLQQFAVHAPGTLVTQGSFAYGSQVVVPLQGA